MSTWTNIRHPATMGFYGLGYDALSGNGLFEPEAPYQVDYSGLPAYPGYNPVYDNSQALSPGFSKELQGINPDQGGIQAYRGYALRNGPSPWAKMAEAKSFQDEALARDYLTKNSDSNAATAESNLAMRGGLRSGARERIQRDSGNKLMESELGLAGQGMGNRMQIGINDEQNRVAALGALPGMEVQNASFGLQKANAGQAARESDLQRQMLAQESLNQYNMGRYGLESNIWAAGQQANATSSAGKSKSWLCSHAAKAVGFTYSKGDLKALRMLKKYASENDPVASMFYFSSCHALPKLMTEQGVEWSTILDFIRSVLLEIKSGYLEEAYDRYADFVRTAIDQYWLGCTDPAYTGVAQ